jgi:hypothetical protein
MAQRAGNHLIGRSKPCVHDAQADLQAIGENFRLLAVVLEPHVKTNQAGTT